VLLGRLDTAMQTLAIEEIHRFDNGFVRRHGHDCWDVENLVAQIKLGLEKILAAGVVPASVGVDTWGVDFVLLDAAGEMLGDAVAYRDQRTDGMMAKVFARMPRAEIYARTGIQFQPFNTLYQLAALVDEHPDWLPRVSSLLLMPDYLHYRLCGARSCEITNASTSQLLNLATRDWDAALIDRIGVPAHWFLPLCQPGSTLGEWAASDGRRIKVIAPATHDTASAVLAVPLADEASAYISSGTWSLMGIESRTPCSGADALAANITNEAGVDGSYRVLKNIMGLWLIQRVRDAFPDHSFADLVSEAQAAAPLRHLIDPNDDRFLNPPSMVEAIRAFCRETGQEEPRSAGELARCVFESLAFLYRRTLGELEAIAGQRLARIHIVGGGCQNAFLNQLCADFCRLPVHAGPVEASALGNIAAQLRGLGLLSDRRAVRDLIRRSFPIHTLLPRADDERIEAQWQRFQNLFERESVHGSLRKPAQQQPTPEGVPS
jgi:rhamnulokinase